METFIPFMLVVILGLSLGLIFMLLEVQRNKNSREEYRQLFELSESEYKKAQDKIQDLLLTANNNNVVMERASQALDLANKKITDQEVLVRALDEKLRFQEVQYNKLLGQKKSSEVRTGHIAETMSAFLADYPYPPETGTFLGKPIDMLHFLDDKIVFVEIKSGKSQLSPRQKRIQKLIEDGKVEFNIYRVE